MPNRYYICDGEEVLEEDGLLVKQPVVAGMGLAWVGVGADDNGKWLVVVNTNNHRKLVRDSRFDALPVFPLNGKMNALNTPAKAALTAVMSRRGFAASVNGADGYRGLLNSVGRELRPAFDVDKFNVGG